MPNKAVFSRASPTGRRDLAARSDKPPAHVDHRSGNGLPLLTTITYVDYLSAWGS